MATAAEMAAIINDSKNIVFLTGAGVSTASGIPDYRSMEGIYTTSGLKEPEYLLSRQAMLYDTDNFYRFIRQLYQTEAQPNIIHQKITELAEKKNVTVITQNIDGLHRRTQRLDVIEFHGTLAECHCENCFAPLSFETFLQGYRHESCGGIIRPDVVLYDEQIDYANISRSINALKKADTIAVIGTSFRVYPFAGLVSEASPSAKILTINKETLDIPTVFASYVGDAAAVFEKL